MKFDLSLTKIRLLYLLLTAILTSHSSLPANAIDFSLLIGEWSKPGQCNKERYIYSSNRKYTWAQKKGNIWRTTYKGIYVLRPEQKAVVIGDRLNTGGYTIDINELTQTTYKGEWNISLSEGLSFDNPNDAKFTFIKCSGNLVDKK
jgi:hypothetical protein